MTLTAAQAGNKQSLPMFVSNVGKAAQPELTPTPQLANLIKVTLTDPTAASTTAYMSAGVAGPNTTTTTVSRSSFDGALGTAGKPDYPRNAVVTVTHASAVVALSGTITGIDLYGKTLTEAWSVTAGTTSKTFTGKKAFYRIDSISITAASDASTDTVKLGTGVVFGLPFKCNSVVPLGEMTDGAIPTAGTIVATSTTSTDDARGTYSPNQAPNGSKDYVFYFFCDDPTTATGANN